MHSLLLSVSIFFDIVPISRYIPCYSFNYPHHGIIANNNKSMRQYFTIIAILPIVKLNKYYYAA